MTRTNLNMTKGYRDQNPSHSSSSSVVSIELETMDSSRLQSPFGSPHSVRSDYSESSSIGSIDSGIKRQGYCRRPWRYQSRNVEEKGLGYDDGDDKHHGISCCFYYFSAVFLGVGLPLLILWVVSRQQKPDLFLESITFYRYSIEEGMDRFGIVTSASTNSSLKLTFTNTATFSGVHVTSIPLEIKNCNELPVATGNIPNFYQPRKSARSIDVMVEGSHIPLYIAADDYVLGESIPLTLNMIVKSKANVFWILVTHKFNMKIECSLTMDPKKMGVPISLTNKCKTFNL